MTIPRNTPLILFAHGAGAPSSHPFMRAWAARLAAFGVVETFDYPYMAHGRGRPDRQPVLIAAHRDALAAARQRHPGRPTVLAGKSMGSRIAGHLALDADPPVAALVCFGFPLGSGAKATLRAQTLLALTTPIFFAQGTRDPLCPLGDLEAVRRQMKAPSRLHVLPGGDHSLQAAKRTLGQAGQTQEDADAALARAIGDFLASTLG